MIYAFTGTPGTGKTTLAKRFAKEHNLKYIDLNEFSKQHKLFEGYDRSKRCFIVDTKRLSKEIQPELGDVVIDSHVSHHMPKINLCIVTVCTDLKKLERRLKSRGYTKTKIRDNLDAEIFKVCETDAAELGLRLLILDTSKLSVKDCLKKISAEKFK